jgi:hypothetical protein
MAGRRGSRILCGWWRRNARGGGKIEYCPSGKGEWEGKGKIGLVNSTYAVLPHKNFVLEQKHGIGWGVPVCSPTEQEIFHFIHQ